MTALVLDREYTIVWEDPSICRIELASNPSIFFEIYQNEPLRASIDSGELRQLRNDLFSFSAILQSK